MKKPAALAEAIAKKAFNSPKFQQSWQVHTQAFGPILLPAYEECYTAKVHLTNILNKISVRDIAGAKSVMETLIKSCGCDTPKEKALLCFLEGLCCEWKFVNIDLCSESAVSYKAAYSISESFGYEISV